MWKSRGSLVPKISMTCVLNSADSPTLTAFHLLDLTSMFDFIHALITQPCLSSVEMNMTWFRKHTWIV